MATPIDAGSIYSDVRVRLDKLSGDIQSVKTQFDKLGKNLTDSSNKTTKTQTENFKKFELAGVAAIGAVTLAFKQSVSVFAQTEQKMANVKAVSNATAAEFAVLEKAAADAGTTTRFTAGQAADALFYLSSAGLDATQSVDALDGVLQLAGATGSDLAQSAQAVTSTLSQFGLEASKSADVSNVFAAANSNSQATLDKLQNSLRQVGPVAAGLGISLEETVGSLQALYNAGFQGESAGRALKSALADLANESSPTIAKLEKLGVSFADVNPEVVGLTGAIGTLEDAGLSTAQVIDAFGKVAGPQMVTLIGSGEAALRDYEEAVTGTNEAARQYAVQNDTLAGSFDAFKSAVEGTSNSLIGQLSPVFRLVLDAATALLRLINKMPEVLKGMGAGAGAAALGVGVLTKALALLGVTVGTGALAPVVAIAALGVGLTTLIARGREIRQQRLADEFGYIAEEAGLAGQAVDEFTKRAGEVENALSYANMATDADVLLGYVTKITKQFGLTEEEVFKVAQASSTLGEGLKSRLSELQKITAETHAIAVSELQRASGALARIEIEKALVEQAREEARLAAEASAREADRAAHLARLEEIKQRLLTIDELSLRGALSEAEALDEKKALREEEVSILLDQAVTSGEVTDEIIKDIQEQEEAIKRYEKRLEILKKEEEDRAKASDKNTEAIAAAWDDLAKRREARHAAMLEQIGIDEEKAGSERRKRFQQDLGAYSGLMEQASDAVTELFKKNSEEAVDEIGDILISIGAQTGNVYVAAAGLALKFTQDFIQALNKEDLEIQDALLAIFVPFGPQIISATKDNEEKLKQTITDAENEIASIVLDNRKKTLDLEYEAELEAIENIKNRRIDSIENTLTEEQELNLKALGVLEESELDKNERLRESAIETLEGQLEKEVELRADATDSELGKALEAIDTELAARLDALGELSEEEQALVDFKAQLSAEEDERERAETLARIDELRQAGEDAEADLLQQKLDNEDQLAALKEAADIAEQERIEAIAQAEEEAAAAKQVAKEAELAQLQANSQAEIDAINAVFDAQQRADSDSAAVEAEYRRKIAQYEYDKAVFDKSNSIAQAEANKLVAVSEVPWYDSGIFGDVDDQVAALYDQIISQLQSAPLPSLPQFQTGGIVLPQRGGTPVVMAENGAPELALNAGTEGEALLSQFAAKLSEAGAGGGGSFVFQLVVDGRTQAESVVRYINNGIVKLEA